ncbi:hypothetical protein XB02_15580 [Pantoea ananatis]|nr:hypothetical protein XB02_15580 [Pantoea ananatis]
MLAVNGQGKQDSPGVPPRTARATWPVQIAPNPARRDGVTRGTTLYRSSRRLKGAVTLKVASGGGEKGGEDATAHNHVADGSRAVGRRRGGGR